MTHKQRGVISLLLAITMITILTASISLMFQRIRITQEISQQSLVAQQAFQAAYSGLEHWMFKLTSPGIDPPDTRRDIPRNDPNKDWQCMDGSVISESGSCGNNLPRYRVVCQTCGAAGSNPSRSPVETPNNNPDNDSLLSRGQKVYQGNTVTRALKVDF